MRLLVIALFVCLLSTIGKAQVPTFERTYNDIGIFGGNASNPVELDSGIYCIASSGYSLFVEEGGFQRVHTFDDGGNILIDNMLYDQSRRFFDFCSLIRSNDGNLLVFNTLSRAGGTGGNQIFVLKLSPDLQDTLWSYYHHDSLYYDTPQDLIETPTGDIALVATRGYFTAPDNYDGYFIKLNSQGELISEALIDEDVADMPKNIICDINDGFIMSGIAGITLNIDLVYQYLIKLDANGIRQDGWQLPQITEGGMSRFGPNKLLFSGYKYQAGGSKLIMTDLEANVIFNKTYSSLNSSTNYIGRRVSDGGIVSVGINNTTVNAGFIMKSDSLGNLLWRKEYDHGNGADFFLDFIETKDGGLLISGAADDDFCCGGQNAWVIKLDANGCLDPANCGVGIEDAPFPDAVTIYPNPATDWLRIDLETAGSAYTAQLLDGTGRLVQNEVFSALGTHTLSLSNLATGIYYCRVLKGGEIIVTEKVVKVN